MNTSRVLATTFAAAALLAAWSAHAQRPAKRPAAAATADPAPAAEGVVNLNTATAEQLMLLPGIGPAKAEAILDARRRQPFAAVDQVLRVRGIGRATLRRLRPYLVVRGETTLARPVAGRRSAGESAAEPEPPRRGR